MRRSPNMSRISRRNLFIAMLSVTLTVLAPNLSAANSLGFNDLTTKSIKNKGVVAGFIAADMSSGNKSAVLVRVHNTLVDTDNEKAKVIEFLKALAKEMVQTEFPLDGIALVEDSEISDPLVFFPYYNGYIHPHVKGGIIFVSGDTMANAQLISQGLELSRIAQRRQ